jgi:flagellar biosynthesis protein
VTAQKKNASARASRRSKTPSATTPWCCISSRSFPWGQIIAVAEAHGIAVRQDEDLAAMLDLLDIDAPIPVAAFAAVAEILGHLYRVNDRMRQERDEAAP